MALAPFAGTFDPHERLPLCLADDDTAAPAPVIRIDGAIDSFGGSDSPPDDHALAREWRRRGSEMAGALKGDFALLVWDDETRTGLLARDQLGARSIYLHRRGSRLTFATEIRDLLALLDRTPDPNPVALATWAGLGDLRGGDTLFDGVRKLAPGSLIELERGGFRERRYWRPVYGGTIAVGRQDAVAMVRSELERAVARRSRPGSTTAIQLSGGLDSSVVAALAMRGPSGQRPMAGYSATFPSHSTMDESALIDELAGSIGLRSVQLRVRGGSVLAGALDYQREYKLPLHSPNLHYQRPLFERMAGDGVDTVLDGEGGDELFGAVRYLMADRVRHGRPLAAVALARRFPGAGATPPWGRVLPFVFSAGVKPALPHALHERGRRLGDQSRHVSPWLRDRAARDFLAAQDPWAWERQAGPRWWAYLADLMTDAMDAVNSYPHLNRRAALAGLVCRHPLRDLDLVELVLRLPPELAFDPHLSRPLLREAVAGIVPDAIRLRAAKGVFEPLFHQGLKADLPILRDLLGAEARIGAVVDLAAVRAGLLDGPDRCPRGRLLWAEDLWRLATAECWLRELEEPGFADRLLASGVLAAADASFGTDDAEVLAPAAR